MSDISKNILQGLFDLQDTKYASFIGKLTPGLEPDHTIGVRMPAMRLLAKEYCKLPLAELMPFLSSLPHHYYEENMLHGLIICNQKDYDETLRLLEDYLPYVSNWAECDTLSPRSFKQKKNRARLLEDIQRWLASELPFVKRFGMGQLMNHFLDEGFQPEHLQWVAAERMDHYYVRMGAAWYFATALAKQYEATLPIIENRILEPWTHNKSIQKAIESYRVSDEHKAVLRALRYRE